MDPVIIGIGGPVGAGKTKLVERIANAISHDVSMAAITNDIYTIEDAKILAATAVLPEDRILGIETGGCPHTAIREDTSMNEAAIAELRSRHPDLELIFVESGGDNLSATFSPELVDFAIYVIDVAQGEKIPRKAGQGMIRSDLFVINKVDLAPHVEDDRDAQIQRLLDAGATRADVGQTAEVTWTVLADPEGNEFCVLSSRDR